MVVEVERVAGLEVVQEVAVADAEVVAADAVEAEAALVDAEWVEPVEGVAPSVAVHPPPAGAITSRSAPTRETFLIT